MCFSRIVLSIFLCCAIATVRATPVDAGTRPPAGLRIQHDVYLANTEHELHIYRIYGEEPGKTLMLIGGIQGDEPGGYLTADLYADISLKRGNLIVVPRANFYSILLNRRDGLSGDMNRKFAEQSNGRKDMEQEIVTILKGLIGEADCLLNLHEGSGFFNPQWKDDQENPDRFGQSIIYDSARYPSARTGQPIDLQDLASRITTKVNREIANPRYHFRPNNHNTVANETRHPEQRKSATYYALTQEGIPAFGVETSKAIRTNSEKIGFQKQVINAFMAALGIIPETPGQHIESVRLDYVLVKINANPPYAVESGTTLPVKAGDEVAVTDIIADNNRGLTADFLGMGSLNDTRFPFRLAENTRIVIRKDAATCGWVDIAVANRSGAASAPVSPVALPMAKIADRVVPNNELKAEQLIVDVDGKLVSVAEGEEIGVGKSTRLIIKGVRSNISRLDNDILVNLKGYAPPKSKNDGNDLNFPIYPQQDLWIRYSENKDGVRYPISTTYQDREIGKFWLKIL